MLECDVGVSGAVRLSVCLSQARAMWRQMLMRSCGFTVKLPSCHCEALLSLENITSLLAAQSHVYLACSTCHHGSSSSSYEDL